VISQVYRGKGFVTVSTWAKGAAEEGPSELRVSGTA
jgi:hypothetical protein